jgi:hypothetical protein
MIDTAVELAGGLLKFVLAGLVLLAAAEAACRLFFWIREREKEGK